MGRGDEEARAGQRHQQGPREPGGTDEGESLKETLPSRRTAITRGKKEKTRAQ